MQFKIKLCWETGQKKNKTPWQNLFLVTEDNAIGNSNGNKDQCIKFPTYEQTHIYLKNIW